jgi:hypothetical protein
MSKKAREAVCMIPTERGKNKERKKEKHFWFAAAESGKRS